MEPVPRLAMALRRRSNTIRLNNSASQAVILTYTTPQYKALTNNLLCTLAQRDLLKHTVVAVNETQHCAYLAPEYRQTCALASPPPSLREALELRSGDYGTRDYLKRILFKPQLFVEAISQGVTLIYLDGDIAVKRNFLDGWQHM